jgi:hypothetical protein
MLLGLQQLLVNMLRMCGPYTWIRAFACHGFELFLHMGGLLPFVCMVTSVSMRGFVFTDGICLAAYMFGALSGKT